MSQTHTLKATTRKRSGSAALKQMRREGFVPAVLYGAKQESLNLKVDAKKFGELLHGSAGENLLINLDIEDQSGGAKMALIQDVQHDPLSSLIIHADFHAVSADEKIHASVPMELTGMSTGVKEGGVLQHQIHSISVHCLPKDLPETLQADVSDLQMGQALHVSDLKFPEGVSVALEGEVVIAIVTD